MKLSPATVATLCALLPVLSCTPESGEPATKTDASPADARRTITQDASAEAGSLDTLDDASPSPQWDAGPWRTCDEPGRIFQLRDLGTIPAAVNGLRRVGDRIFASSYDGVWMRSFRGTSETWQSRGLQGVFLGRVTRTRTGALLTARVTYGDTTPGIFRSENDGATWTVHGADSRPVFDLVSIGAQSEILIGGLDGPGLTRSLDDGRTWQVIQPAVGCPFCRLAPVPEHPGSIYRGCECPLDSAYIERVDLSRQPHAREILLDERHLDNRRINSFAVFGPGILFAGVEGGLVRLERRSDGTWSHRWLWIVDSQGAANGAAYTYVTTIWVDPCNERHLVFGGYAQNRQPCGGAPTLPFQLYETQDAGNTIRPFPLPGFDPCHWQITYAGDLDESGSAWGMALATGLNETRRAHILVYEN